MDLAFFLNAALLGVGLAMDACTVSIADGLGEPGMSRNKQLGIAGCFGLFQALMPMLGWFLVRFAVSVFSVLSPLLPWISLFLLLFIGIRMILRSLKDEEEESASGLLTVRILIVQALATSIDALSVGFTTAAYPALPAAVSSLIIGLITFFLCFLAVSLGKRVGAGLSKKAERMGGIVLICVGIELFLKGILFP